MKRLLPESLAQAGAGRPLAVLGVWLVLGVIARLISTQFLDSAITTELHPSGGIESERARKLVENRLGAPDSVTEIVVIRSETLTVDDSAFQQKAASVSADLMALGPEVVTAGLNYWLTGDESLVAADRKTTIMPVNVVRDLEQATENVEGVVHVATEADGRDGFRVLVGGEASIAWERSKLAESDLQKGESSGIPVALLILLIISGSAVAAALPIGLAIVSIGVSLGIASLVGQAFALSFFVTLTITMIGLAIGIDYSLLVVSRYRGELRRGEAVRDAVAKAGATAGRTVLFSGFTVVFALGCILIIPSSFFQSLGLGATSVVLVRLAATATLLFAVLALLGPRVNSLGLPFVGRAVARPDSAGDSREGIWDAITRAVTRLPLLSLLVVGGAMIAAAVFLFQIHTWVNGVDVNPEGSFARDALFIPEEEFSFGVINHAEIVIDGDVGSPEAQEAMGKLSASIQADTLLPAS